MEKNKASIGETDNFSEKDLLYLPSNLNQPNVKLRQLNLVVLSKR